MNLSFDHIPTIPKLDMSYYVHTQSADFNEWMKYVYICYLPLLYYVLMIL